jgi:hypothetical protein
MTLHTLIWHIRNLFQPPRLLTEDEVRRLLLTCPQFAEIMSNHNYDPARHKVIFSRKQLSEEQAKAIVRPLPPIPLPAKESSP